MVDVVEGAVLLAAVAATEGAVEGVEVAVELLAQKYGQA